MFKVLVVAFYFPPMGLSKLQRALKFVKYMKEFNWEPTVLTTGEVKYFAYDEYLLKEINQSNIKIVRVGDKEYKAGFSIIRIKKLRRELFRKILNRLGQTFFIPDIKISWAKKAYAKAEELLKENEFDAVFVTGPPFSIMHVFSQLKKKYNIPLIVDYRDQWYRGYFSFYPTPIHRLLHKKWEYNALRAADRIIVSNRKIKENILNTYQFLTFNDVVIITNSFDIENINQAKILPKTSRRMILTFSGIFMIYNTPKYFLKAFKEISVEQPEVAKNIELHFLGFLRNENHRKVKKLNLQEFVYDHGFVNHQESFSRILNSDVLWVVISKKKNIDAILPGKIYEYFASKKPIIGCVPDGATKIVLQEYPASYICKPNDVAEIKATILKVYEHYKENKFPKVEDEFLENFRSDILTEKLTKEFQFLVKTDLQ